MEELFQEIFYSKSDISVILISIEWNESNISVLLEAMRCTQYPIMLNYCSSAIDWFYNITDIEYSNSIRVLLDFRFVCFKHKCFSWKFIQVELKNWDAKKTIWNITWICQVEENTKNSIRNEIHFNICS